MYIAAFLKETVGLCSTVMAKELSQPSSPWTLEKLQELEDCPEDRSMIGNYQFEEQMKNWLKIFVEQKTDINPTSHGDAVTKRYFRYYRKSDLLLVPMPKALEELLQYLPDLRALRCIASVAYSARSSWLTPAPRSAWWLLECQRNHQPRSYGGGERPGGAGRPRCRLRRPSGQGPAAPGRILPADCQPDHHQEGRRDAGSRCSFPETHSRSTTAQEG
jgi:hypothetical protein